MIALSGGLSTECNLGMNPAGSKKRTDTIATIANSSLADYERPLCSLCG